MGGNGRIIDHIDKYANPYLHINPKALSVTNKHDDGCPLCDRDIRASTDRNP